MLAANRNDRVKGRTIILVVSIRTRNGLSHLGAPSGKKCAIDAFVFLVNLDKIIDNHNGRPNLNVKIKWLDNLNVQGISPDKFITTIIINSGVTIDLIPLRLNIKVRDSWVYIIDKIGDKIADCREDFIQKID